MILRFTAYIGRKAFYSMRELKKLEVLIFDFCEISQDHYVVDLNAERQARKMPIRFVHTADQKDTINQLKKDYGTTLDGLSKIVMRQPHVYNFFRGVERC